MKRKFIMFVLTAAIITSILLEKIYTTHERSFTIDHENNTFLMDGKPFRYVSGSFHYFRALPSAWRSRMRTMRAGGLNAIDTYIEWSLHNPEDGIYNWENIADFVEFLEIAKQEDFYVILRPGPYIDSERDNGGLPYWLFKKYHEITMRTTDENFILELRKWWSILMPKIQPYLYGNGGIIIMVQVENEYGDYPLCEQAYLQWLYDETFKYVKNNAVLFTVDTPEYLLKCGKVEGIFTTTDFGINRLHDIEKIWKMLREIQPTGPLVNSEFYVGWLDHWKFPNEKRDPQEVADVLRVILGNNANVNIYMYFGGTNFGFTSGAHCVNCSNYCAITTSYDYDALLDEAGGIRIKYELIRSVIQEFIEIPDISFEEPQKRLAYGEVSLTPIIELLSDQGRELLADGVPITCTKPKTFEELGQAHGLLLYQTKLPKLEIDPTLLTIKSLHDRAYVFVDQQYIGTLSRAGDISVMPLNKGLGINLEILIENQGRINYPVLNDTKGLLGAVTLQKLNGTHQELRDWTMTRFPLKEETIQALVSKHKHQQLIPLQESVVKQRVLRTGPLVYHGVFNVTEVGDTFLNPSGWGKGVAYINGFNLGRYWPLVGPQLTLYVPNQILRLGENTIELIEFQRANKLKPGDRAKIKLDDAAQLNTRGTE